VAKAELQVYMDREVEIQRSLCHPNIVKLHDSFKDDQHLYILLEYASGGQLFSFLRRNGRMSEKEAALTFSDVTNALSHLHRLGIAHRDLKPENVMLFPRDDSPDPVRKRVGVAKLADFGWCADVSLRGRRTFCGTMDYLSPEMISHEEHDHRVDIWAAGVLLYEMLVCEPPFYAKSTAQSLDRILRVDLQLPLLLSAGVRQLLRAMIRLRPEERIGAEEALKNFWVTGLLKGTSAEALMFESATVPRTNSETGAVRKAPQKCEIALSTTQSAPNGLEVSCDATGQARPMLNGATELSKREAFEVERTSSECATREPAILPGPLSARAPKNNNDTKSRKEPGCMSGSPSSAQMSEANSTSTLTPSVVNIPK